MANFVKHGKKRYKLADAPRLDTQWLLQGRCQHFFQSGIQCDGKTSECGSFCREHGGKSKTLKGIYGTTLNSTLGASIDSVKENKSDDLDDEIDMMRTVCGRLTQILDKITSQGYISAKQELPVIEALSDNLVKVSELLEAQAKLNDRESITPEQVEFVVECITKVMVEKIRDNEILSKVLERMKSIPWPSSRNFKLARVQARVNPAEELLRLAASQEEESEEEIQVMPELSSCAKRTPPPASVNGDDKF